MVELPPAPTAAAHEQLRPRLVRHVLPFFELGEQAGADLDRLLAEVGLSRRALRDPKAQVPTYQMKWLLDQLIAQCADPELGLRAAERTNLIRSEFLGNLIRHVIEMSTDLLTVLELLAYFGTHVARTIRIAVTVDDSVVIFGVVPVVECPNELYDCFAGACCTLIETLGGSGLRPQEVRLPRPCPASPERFEKFFGATVVFDAPQLQLVYARDALCSPVREEAPPETGALAASLTQGGNALALLIRTHVLARLAEGVPLLPSVARKLGLSARTLRRRLSEARSSYAELVDEARRERALALARRAELDVGRLAELTGFTDASAFARAFRRWTGERPGEYMRRARGRTRVLATGSQETEATTRTS